MDILNRMLAHDEWTTLQLLERSRDLTDEQLDHEFDIGLETLRRTFDHMIFNVDAWRMQMAGEPIDVDRSDTSIPALIERHRRSYAEFAEHSRNARDGQQLEETFVDGYNVRQEIGATIIHVILHNAGHRSEILHILKRLGVTDLPEGDPQEWWHLAGPGSS